MSEGERKEKASDGHRRPLFIRSCAVKGEILSSFPNTPCNAVSGAFIIQRFFIVRLLRYNVYCVPKMRRQRSMAGIRLRRTQVCKIARFSIAILRCVYAIDASLYNAITLLFSSNKIFMHLTSNSICGQSEKPAPE